MSKIVKFLNKYFSTFFYTLVSPLGFIFCMWYLNWVQLLCVILNCLMMLNSVIKRLNRGETLNSCIIFLLLLNSLSCFAVGKYGLINYIFHIGMAHVSLHKLCVEWIKMSYDREMTNEESKRAKEAGDRIFTMFYMLIVTPFVFDLTTWQTRSYKLI